MPSFILRHLDPDFWARVQAKAKAEGVPLKALILRLLTSWLAAGLVVGLVGCAAHLPTGPEAVLPTAQTTPASIRLTLASRPDRTYDVTATVLTADGHFVKDVTLTFTMDAGTVTPETATTNGNGVAQAVASTVASATLTVAGGSLTASTRVDGVAPPVTIPPIEQPPPTPLPPPSISLQPTTTTVGVSTFFATDAFVSGGQPVRTTSWTFGDGGTVTHAGSSASHTYTTAGTFTATVTATDALGRRASTSAPVTVNAVIIPPPPPPPTLSASITCTAAMHGVDSTCNVAASYGGTLLPSIAMARVDWDWGDGIANSSVSPVKTHTYLNLGNYTVLATVTATTVDGAKTATTAKAIVIP